MSNDELACELMLEYAQRPPATPEMSSPTFTVKGGNPACGDTVTLQVKLEDGKVVDAHLKAAGCLINRASTGLLNDLVANKTITELEKLSLKDIEQGIGTEFRSRIKCAILPLFLLQEGLKCYLKSPTPGSTFEVTAPRNLGM